MTIILRAPEGKTFERVSDHVVMGEEIFLGEEDKVEDFQEIDETEENMSEPRRRYYQFKKEQEERLAKRKH